MTKITSTPLEISSSAKEIFDFLSNFQNFGTLMPPQISNWQATENSCSFTIQNMATLAMRIQEKIEPTKLLIVSEKPSPFSFELICEFAEKSENTCVSTIRFNADMNPMLAMMVKNPLQNFVNILNDQLKKRFS